MKARRCFTRSSLRALLLVSAVLALRGPIRTLSAADLELKKGEHISLIGNTLADRMQHDGRLEAYFHTRFPRHELTIRNLGFSGDELTIRLRSADFGSPDRHLTDNKTDVVLAFFGYNESYGDLAKFRKDLDDFIKHTLSQKYNGKSAPRLVLFSPIAHENLKTRFLPDGKANNVRLEAAAKVVGEAAAAAGVTYVDLFHPTLELYEKADKPLTSNGIHPTSDGYELISRVIDKALFGDEIKRDPQAFERVRLAVVDKNFYWYNRYRTVDGYSMYGGRADLRFTDGQTNRVVMQRELEVLDVMTANRDKRIWAVAQGNDLVVDDSNTPPFIPVKTNKPGAGPNGEHIFLDGDEAIKSMTVGKGLKVNLFASEKQFPELAKPVQMSFDAKGRMWVAAWPTYPHWKPKEEMNDKLLIFEDTDGDGRADKMTVFADNLHCPTGFEFVRDGVLVAQAPDLIFLKDTNGDDKADVRERVLSGLDTADTHHTSNSFRLDPGGAVYFQEGTFHHTQVETPYGPAERCVNAGVFRYEPMTQKFETYVSYPFANPHGHSFDRWGQDFVTDGTGNVNYFAAAFSGHVDFPMKHDRLRPFFQQRTRPCPGTEIVSSKHFPDDWQGDYLVANVIGFQGILRYNFRDEESGFAGDEAEPVLSSTDPSFRPSDLEIGPDGALYFIEWQNPIIGHMQHNLRDPNRDRVHGRIYKVVHEGRPLSPLVKIAGEPIEKLLDLLKEPEDRVRYRVKIELGGRDSDAVVAAVDRWITGLDSTDPEYEHHMLEALWVYQYHDVVKPGHIKRMLASSNFRARAAAVRVLCYQRDRVEDAIDLLKKAATDPYPRVRLEAVRAASFFRDPRAIEIALLSAEQPSDYYLDYTRGETMKTLEPYWKKALAEGKEIAFSSDVAARFFLKNVRLEDLLKMKPSRGVNLELLLRQGVRDEVRRRALAMIATESKRTAAAALIEALRSVDHRDNDPGESVVLELIRVLTDRDAAELAAVRGDLETFATRANLPVLRQFGFAALISADGKIDRAWELGSKSIGSLRDLVTAAPMVRDPGLLTSLHAKIEPLLNGLPANLATGIASKGSVGRFVRVELPGPRRTLTLAEVEVVSDGRNVARQGKASQTNTSNGGDAAKAIDGNTSGAFGDGGQTHSVEGTRSPWWEVDLGSEFPIDSVSVYNRTEGEMGRRLEGFTLKVLDASRNVVLEKSRVPAPDVKTTFELGGGSEGSIRRAAMLALTYTRGREEQTFKTLAKFVKNDVDRHAAILALQRIPAAYRPADEARPLLESILGYVRKLPVADRTSAPARDALQLGDTLTSLLPADLSKSFRKQLSELGVRVIRIGTLPEQMLFDVDRIVVQAGKPVEIVFENNDLMPHNFVVTRPGSLEEVGLLGEATATQPDSLRRQYVPASDKVMFSSRLLQPREVQRLTFTAPSTTGVYPYVCTYPAHWRRMYGALYVVDNLEDYLANPESYLAAHPTEAKDELLKFIRPRKEWTFQDLVGSVAQLNSDRSFNNGRQLFQAANCVACHRLNGVGNEIGPDLAKLDAKIAPTDILRSMLEPSNKIEDKYVTYQFELQSGRVVTGMVIEETPDSVKVVENPLASTQTQAIKKSEIAARLKSATSIMPKGILDRLSREEILDLVSYVVARGDRRNPIFQGADGHSGHH